MGWHTYITSVAVVIVQLVVAGSAFAQNTLDSAELVVEDYVDDSLDLEDYYPLYESRADSMASVRQRKLAGPLAPRFDDVPAVPNSQITQAQWDSLGQGRAYKNKVPPQVADAKDGVSWWSIGEGLSSVLSAIAWVLVVALLLGGIGYLVYNQQQRGRIERSRETFGVTDELLAATKEELDDALSQNLAAGNYREAIRYRFGKLLQLLRTRRLLRWVPGKTNDNYASELDDSLRAGFVVLAKAFSYAYYSGRHVTREAYEEFEQLGAGFESSIPSQTRRA